ncbi:MAG TPA: sporulation protein YtfJ [Firmicutes bacterium]|nr:sporulation protein YtfJ [Bacillota bacterium]
MGHPIENLMKTTMESLKAMVDVNTVVGEAVETKDGTVIVPVSRVTFGFVAGGGDEASMDQGEAYQTSQTLKGQDSGMGNEGNLPFTGGSGAGVSVKPVGFLVVGAGKVRFLPVDSRAVYDRLLEAAPDLLDKLADIMERRHCQEEEVEIIEPRH